MVNEQVGIQYLVGVLALWGGVLYHSWEVNNLTGVKDLASYIKGLPKYDRFLAKWTGPKVALASFAGAFLLSLGLLSIPAVGPYLALAVGGAFVYDALKAKKLKKSLAAKPVNEDVND